MNCTNMTYLMFRDIEIEITIPYLPEPQYSNLCFLIRSDNSREKMSTCASKNCNRDNDNSYKDAVTRWNSLRPETFRQKILEPILISNNSVECPSQFIDASDLSVPDIEPYYAITFVIIHSTTDIYFRLTRGNVFRNILCRATIFSKLHKFPSQTVCIVQIWTSPSRMSIM